MSEGSSPNKSGKKKPHRSKRTLSKKANKQAALLAPSLPRTKKVLGQHWLVDPVIIQHIIDDVAPTADDTIVEIGPGPGVITKPMAATDAKHIHAIELDKRLGTDLAFYFESNAIDKVTVHKQDVLSFDYNAIESATFKVVGNLPYQITSLILFHLFGELDDTNHPWRHRIESATLMVQKEVAERLIAEPSSKAYNALSIYAQLLCDVRITTDVPPSSFKPPPRVDSAVVQLIPRKEWLYDVANPKRLRQIIKTAFTQRRKTVRNGLQSLMNDELQATLFAQVDAEHSELLGRPLTELRPDAIPIPAWVTLANAWDKHQHHAAQL
jgi:16S rRNA (adenine1518-N6/adenine1519-N6)-dimethyltransferase